MRTTLGYLAFTLALSIGVYLGLGSDAYVLIRMGETAMQMTLWVAILLLCVLLMLMSLLWKLIRGTLLGDWHKAWQRQRLEKLTTIAVKSYTDQDWPKAHKLLVKLANLHPHPQSYILMAAEAAVASGEIEKGRETYQQALSRFPDNAFQINIKLGYLELGLGNYEEALEISDQLIAKKKLDAEARLLQILIAEDKGDLEQLHDLLKTARTQKVLAARLPMIERRYVRACLSSAVGAPHLAKLADMVIAGAKLTTKLIIDLSRQLILKGQPDKAEQMLRKRIDQQWDLELVTAYANIEGKSAKAQVKAAETWLMQHADEPVLFETIKVLALRADDSKRVAHYEDKLSQL